MRTQILVFLLFLGEVLGNYTSYKKYIVLDITPTNESDVEFIARFEESHNFDFWSSVRELNHPIRIMMDIDRAKRFAQTLKKLRIYFHLAIRNIDKAFENERNEIRAQRHQSDYLPQKISSNIYHDYEEILIYLHHLSRDYSQFVECDTYGHSYEGRELVAIKIGNRTSTNPTIFIDGGMHGREWIGTAVALFIIKKLVEREKNRKMSDNINWIIIPVANPDGYEYSQTTDRLWRKTRTEYSYCIGSDPYKNFDYDWVGSNPDDECLNNYSGPEPFSEVETKAFRDYALAADNIVLYISFHSYGNYILYPRNFNPDLQLKWEELHMLGEKVAKSIEKNGGTKYSVGLPPYIEKSTPGTSRNWMMGVVGTRLSYSMELPGGSDSFDPPIGKIGKICNDTWNGIKEFYNYVLQLSLLSEN